MRVASVLAGLVLSALLLLAPPTAGLAREPPNQNDPCSAAGQDTCDTTGVGFYQRYRYGLRWFGDYRGAVPGETQTFCIDLRFWYPSPDYRFRETAGGALKNRDGRAVALESQQRMAYAVWTYGRSPNANQQAAVMLYVHGLMGDAEPGEVDPAAVNPKVAALHERIDRDAARFHGPYRIETKLSPGLTVGKSASATIRVLSAEGHALPNLRLALAGRGAGGLPARVRTSRAGVAQVRLVPTDAAGVRVGVTTEPLPSTMPRIFAPTVPAAARNGQRLVAPGSQRVSFQASAPVAPGQITVSSTATPPVLAVGEQASDRVTIGGVPAGWRASVTLRTYGPFRSADAIRCDGPPALETAFEAGPGTVTTPPTTVDRPGWYSYVLVVPGDADHAGATTPCAEPSETFRVEVQPRVTTKVSAATVRPGTAITDTVIVEGLAGEAAAIKAALYGPFPSPDRISCEGVPIWTGTVFAQGDGEYLTEPFTLTVAGYYTYRESIDASELVRASGTACADAAETTIAVGAPTITTAVSAQQTAPGASITDQVIVSGLGAVSAPVQVELWGPFQTPQEIVCTGTPYWTGSFVAEGDGTYTTAPVQLQVAGYYTYRETIAAAPANDPAATACGDVAETTLARATPVVTTVASAEVVRPGSRLSDRIRIRGLGRTPAALEMELFGPFPTRAAIRCDGAPFWSGRMPVAGDGQVTSPSVVVDAAGFYTYRERLVGSAVVDDVTAECGVVAETALSAPAITTGRGEETALIPAASAGPAPTRLRVADLGIDAPVAPVGVDVANGVLGVPPNIRRTGWWRDGAAPGAATGSILIAGHVDSARAGAGSFFRLPQARAGTRVEVATGDGRTHSYRVVSVRRYLKANLPNNVYSLRGRPRLVLVTCGGPFDHATGHYRDNIVVTAVPV